MKVNNPNMKPSNVQTTVNSTADGKRSGRTDKSASDDLSKLGDTTKVNLSERALAMQKAKAIASNDDIDEAKVARFQALIDAGKYNVDAEKIADRLVDEHLLASE